MDRHGYDVVSHGYVPYLDGLYPHPVIEIFRRMICYHYAACAVNGVCPYGRSSWTSYCDHVGMSRHRRGRAGRDCDCGPHDSYDLEI